MEIYKKNKKRTEYCSFYMVGTTETLEIESYSEKGGMAQDVSFQGRKSNKNEVVLCWLTVNYLSLHIYIYIGKGTYLSIYICEKGNVQNDE